MQQISILLAVLAAPLASCAHAFVLDVEPQKAGVYGCRGFQYTIKKNKYMYNATMGDVKLPVGCVPADIFVSSLYIPGACAKFRDNNFGFGTSLDPRKINCKTVDDYSFKTCQLVFDNAPKTSVRTNITKGEYVDEGDICWPADVGFVFVQNRCANSTQSASIGVEVTINKYKGSCETLNVFGRKVGLSKGAIAGIVIGIVVVIILLAACIFCCCCQLRKG